MERDPMDIRYIPISGLQADIVTRLLGVLVNKPEVPDGVIYLLGQIPKIWDENKIVLE